MPSVKYKNGSGWFSVTNSGLKASESTYGVAKIATLAQVEAGSSDDTFITPAKVKNIFYERNHEILHYDWIGTLAEYNQQYEGGTIDPNWICFITDDEITEDLEWGNIIGQITLQTDLIDYINNHTAQFPSQVGNNGKFLTTNGSNTLWSDVLPSQSGNNGKFLKTDGSSTSWDSVDALPSQTSQSGKFLTTNGTTASWERAKPEIIYWD